MSARAARYVALGGGFLVLVLGALGVLDEKDPVVRMNQGIGLLEEYNYSGARRIFEALATEHPDWEAAHVNRGISALNEQKFEDAEKAFRRALELQPKSIHSLVCLGVLYHYTQKSAAALEVFARAVELDPEDPHALYFLSVLEDEKGNAEKSRGLLEKALKIQPSFASALWRLKQSYLKDRPKMDVALKEFVRLTRSLDGGIIAGEKYGEAGRYSLAIRGTAPPGYAPPAAWAPPPSPIFGAPVAISTAEAIVKPRPDGKPSMPAMALGDLSADGVLEVVVPGEKSASGAAETRIYTAAEGGFRALLGLPSEALACAVGDLDSDRSPELVLAGDGWLEVLQSDANGGLVKRELKVEGGNHSGFPVRLCLADADSDWDLDILCLRQEAAGGGTRSRLEVLNNNRDGSFREISSTCGIGPFDFPAVELLVSDLDGDVDADIVLLDGSGASAARAFSNERVWRYGPREIPCGKGPIESAALGDLDGDGDDDIVLLRGASIALLRNEGGLRFREDAAFAERHAGVQGSAGVFGDFTNALRMELLVFGGEAGGSASFIADASAPAVRVDIDLGPVGGPAGACFTSIRRDERPALIIRGSSRGAASYPSGSEGTWLSIELEGPKAPIAKKERSNAGGVGTRIEIRSGTRSASLEAHGSGGGSVRPAPRLHCGLGGRDVAEVARLMWPDGVLQAERRLVAGKTHRIQELDRKPSSCPILFVWTGERFEFVGDFLGVGGLGYFEQPGVYSKPDPSEYLLVPEPKPRDGELVLVVLEPLEEATYLDQFALVAIDHPADVSVLPDEMFAIRGPAPEFRLLAFSEKAFAARARNDGEEDVTDRMRSVDRRYGNDVDLDRRFPGLARKPHWIELDFEDGLDRVIRAGGAPYLFLHGFIEYGYSTSNFAAWQAGQAFRAPSILVEREGSWVPLREEWGFPAGYPRYMSVDLAGLLRPGDRKLRVETNMEIRWDQAFLASCVPVDGADPEITVTDLASDAAVLGFRGFPRETSPDGSVPLVYEHDPIDLVSPFKDFPGSYTRHGEVGELLRAADDRFAIFGPGDGIRISFRADRLPPLPNGRKRTFLVKTSGYCKDMDLYTAHPETVEPLPFRAMTGYPYAPPEVYPADAERDAYRREWNTRLVPPSTAR